MDDRGNIRRFATKEEAVAAGFPHEVPYGHLRDMQTLEAERAATAFGTPSSSGGLKPQSLPERSCGSFCPSIKSSFKQRKKV